MPWKNILKPKKKLELKKEIGFGKSDITESVTFENIEKLENGKVKIKVSFGAGAL